MVDQWLGPSLFTDEQGITDYSFFTNLEFSSQEPVFFSQIYTETLRVDLASFKQFATRD